jgi:hypothetical protein
MFGNLGGAAAGDLALEAFEDDVLFTSRAVRCHPCFGSPSFGSLISPIHTFYFLMKC